MIGKFVTADMYKMFFKRDKKNTRGKDEFPRRENLLQIELDKCVRVTKNEIYSVEFDTAYLG